MKMKSTIALVWVLLLLAPTIHAATETRLPDADVQVNGWAVSPLWSKINTVGGDFITVANNTIGEVSIENPSNAGTYSSVAVEFRARNGGNAASANLFADIRINGALQGVQEVTAALPQGGDTWGIYVLTWPGLNFTQAEMGTLQILFYSTNTNPQRYPQIDFIEATLIYDVGTDDADLAISKTASPAPHYFGSNVTFTVTVTNNGPNNATGVEAIELPGSGFDYVSHVASHGTFDENTDDWIIGALANGASATLTLVATILETGDYENFAEISDADQADPLPINNEVSVTIFPIDLTSVPLSNWSLIIGLGLIISFVVIRFRNLV